MRNYKRFIGNEKEVVKTNMKNMLEWSSIEYRRYKQTKNIVHMQQAGEKLFNAVELYASCISNMRLYVHQAVYQVIHEKTFLDVFNRVNLLHQFFYNAENLMPADQAAIIYEECREKIKNRIERLK